MSKLPNWYLTQSLPAFKDAESFTAIEMTYKLYQAMKTFETEYNSFVDSFNQEWELFETKYNGDIEVFTQSMRQEFQDFIDVIDLKVLGLENEITTIKNIIASDDVNLDTLQELANALKNNVSSINDIFTELAKKQDKLTAGEGINIDSNNVISASGGGIDFSSVYISDYTYEIPANETLSIEPGLYIVKASTYQGIAEQLFMVRTSSQFQYSLKYKNSPGTTFTEELILIEKDYVDDTKVTLTSYVNATICLYKIM